MIISASRRTDIPAFYAEWFMNRVRAGWCAVPNPMNTKQVSKVSLKPTDVDVIVFWSKNPAPLIPHLDELDAQGLRYYFQYTLNGYPSDIEPNVPSLRNRIETFHDLSKRLGAQRVVWRYDPIVISGMTDYDYHRERFIQLADELRGATNRVVISIVDLYKKTSRRLSELEREGFVLERDVEASSNMMQLLKDLAAVAKENEMEIFTCAEEHDYGNIGIPAGQCIDPLLVYKIWGTHLPYKKDSGQRKPCLCTKARDIGVNDTCVHMCRYCYANRSDNIAKSRYDTHDPHSPALWASSIDSIDTAESNSNQLHLFG